MKVIRSYSLEKHLSWIFFTICWALWEKEQFVNLRVWLGTDIFAIKLYTVRRWTDWCCCFKRMIFLCLFVISFYPFFDVCWLNFSHVKLYPENCLCCYRRVSINWMEKIVNGCCRHVLETLGYFWKVLDCHLLLFIIRYFSFHIPCKLAIITQCHNVRIVTEKKHLLLSRCHVKWSWSYPYDIPYT